MSTDSKSEKMAKEYGDKANKAMDKVTEDQKPEVKERVNAAQPAIRCALASMATQKQPPRSA